MEVELSFRVQSIDVSRPSSMICGAPVHRWLPTSYKRVVAVMHVRKLDAWCSPRCHE
jgi:hypothetical protein